MKMMHHKKLIVALVLAVGLLLGLSGSSLAAEVKAGDVINSANIEQYKDYFPMYMQRWIKDGWGFEKPVVIKVKDPEFIPLQKATWKLQRRI
jgi:hypothetical protein